MYNNVCSAFALVLICSFFGPVYGLAESSSEADIANLLINGGFEEGVYSPTGIPDHWIWDPWKISAVRIWDDTEAHSGERSVKIHAPEANDARWIQSVDLDPNQLYFLSGWIKTDNVQHDDGTYHHYVAAMTQKEMDDAAAARDFVETDIPALTSGNMVPRITIRFPDHKLTRLSPNRGGWWPSPQDTYADRDPDFDSVIVIWDTRATDLTTNEYKWIGSADGLTAHMGTGQTYFAMQIAAAIHRGHRNVFKHEWGHSILFFFEAMGTVPEPSVSNHADSTDYVNCITGEYYVWQDETLANPIPNSIYNNESGFTHDYYSGLTATSDQPSRCLGIISEAWSLGGPVTHSGNLEDANQCEYDFNGDRDVDGEDLFDTFIDSQDIVLIGDDDLEDFAEEFGRADCLSNF